MIHAIRNCFVFAAIALAGSAFPAGKVHDPSEFVTTSITVSGVVERKLTLSVDDLKKFPLQKSSEVALVTMHDVNHGKLAISRGVLLRDILEKAVIASKDHEGVKKMIIVATASDGYKAVFSWNEVFNSPMGDGVLVFYERDRKPLTDDEGRIAMISAKDTRTGARHVKWLKAIEVLKIAE